MSKQNERTLRNWITDSITVGKVTHRIKKAAKKGALLFASDSRHSGITCSTPCSRVLATRARRAPSAQAQLAPRCQDALRVFVVHYILANSSSDNLARCRGLVVPNWDLHRVVLLLESLQTAKWTSVLHASPRQHSEVPQSFLLTADTK